MMFVFMHVEEKVCVCVCVARVVLELTWSTKQSKVGNVIEVKVACGRYAMMAQAGRILVFIRLGQCKLTECLLHLVLHLFEKPCKWTSNTDLSFSRHALKLSDLKHFQR